MSPRLAFALNAAHAAGRLTLAHFNVGRNIELKQDQSPVTIADKEAERLIRRLIRETYPSDGILGEEEGETGQAAERWVIDPIDGTKSFMCGVPLYTTLLSFEQDGEPVLGVAYSPALDQMVYAEKGSGTFWNGRPCRVSGVSELSQAALACGGHGSLEKFGRLDGFQKLARTALATRTWSDAYGHMLVATGRIEAMIDPIVNYWDISAVKVIVEEAGGTFSDFSGGSERKNEVITSNGLLHELIVETFRA